MKISDSAPAGEIAIRMADEEVPVGVIARVVQVARDEVHEHLQEAVDAGRIIRIPRPDWHPHPRGVLAAVSIKSMNDEEVAFHSMRVFKVTQLQATVLVPLIRRNEASKEALHVAIQTRAGQKKEDTDIKLVDVVVHHLRRKLRPFKVEIRTLWARGYYIEPEHRKYISELLSSYGAPNGQESPAQNPAAPVAGSIKDTPAKH